MKLVLYYFLLFFIYSIIGWMVETIYIFIRTGKLVNRGFLLGPYCPIYGVSGMVIVFYLDQYKNNVLTVLLLSIVLCSTIEYFTSYLMEKLFKTRWWDYSNRKFNLNGRVCGKNSLLFGFASVFMLYIINPFITENINKLSNNIMYIISIIGLVIFVSDAILSFRTVNKLKETISNIKIKDSTSEIKRLIIEQLSISHKIFQNRVIEAFPNINLDAYIKRKKKRKIRNIFNNK